MAETTQVPSPRSSRRLVVAAAILLAVAGLAALAWWLQPRRNEFYTDADTIRQPTNRVTPRDILWQPPKPLTGQVNSSADDYEPRISADGLTLFFVRGKAGLNAEIHVSTRSREGWSEPQVLAGINSEYDDLGPEPASDGETVYFYSNRPGGLGNYDLWSAHCAADTCEPPTNLGPGVNSEFNDYGPATTPDGKFIYFASNRPRPTDVKGPNPDAWPATVREDLYFRDYDLYSAELGATGAGSAVPMDALNSSHNEGAPAVSPVGDFVYFASDRPGGNGGFDLYRARRLRGTFQTPTNIGIEVNSSANELDPGLAQGGFALCFSSDRPTTTNTDGKPDNYDLYQSASREVFHETELVEVPPTDWAAWWATIAPNLLWALLALLLLLTLIALMGALRNRKLSLMARCLLASLFLHLALMLLFNVWEVTASLADHLSGRGSIKVNLLSSAAGSDLILQIRGSDMNVSMPSAEVPSVQRAQVMPELAMTPPVLHEAAAIAPARIESRPEHAVEFADAKPVRTVSLESQNIPHQDWNPTLSLPDPAVSKMAKRSEPQPDSPKPDRALQPQRPHPNAIGDMHTSSASKLHAVGVSASANLTETAAQQPMQLASLEDMSSIDSKIRPQELPNTRATGSSSLTEISLPVEQSAIHESETPSSFDLPVQGRQRSRETTLVGSPGEASPAKIQQLAPSTAGTSLAATEVSLAAFSSIEALETASFLQGGRSPSSTVVVADRTASHSEYTLPQAQHEPGMSVGEARASLTPAISPAPGSMARPSILPKAEPFAIASLGMARSDKPPGPALPGSLDDLFVSGRKAGTTSPTKPDILPGLGLIPDLRLPTEDKPPESVYPQRAPEQRRDLVKKMGGSDKTERAVAAALKWLAAHQSEDGSWSGSGFDRQCNLCGGETSVEVDTALTGLALLCFLGADHTHEKDGPYKNHVRRGLRWLLARQKSDGDLRGGETLYSQGIATIALSEAYGMTGDGDLATPVQHAIDFIAKARNKEVGGWRYDPGQAGDTSVLGWQVMAMKSAKTAALTIPADALEAARHWMTQVSTPSKPGLYAYQPRREFTPAMTAEGMFIQLLLGLGSDDPTTRASADYIARHLPDWENNANTYYWYYATLALFQQQGRHWERWNRKLTQELLSHQRTDGAAAGSWDPDGEWATTGGRVYQTALCTLMLEVYYRYLPLYTPNTPREAIGSIRGRVTHAETGAALAGAIVRLDIADGSPIAATTGADGTYALDVPEVPSFFALSVSADRFIPQAVNMTLRDVRGTTVVRDFALELERASVVTVEDIPEVHHLGDDRFEGQINSQFQKRAEGAHFFAEFEIAEGRLNSNWAVAELRMLVKGVQREHELRINGHLLDRRLDRAPSDGSFGEFVTVFDASLLKSDMNAFEIFAKSLGGDVDDFEFVNVEIRLSK